MQVYTIDACMILGIMRTEFSLLHTIEGIRRMRRCITTTTTIPLFTGVGIEMDIYIRCGRGA